MDEMEDKIIGAFIESAEEIGLRISDKKSDLLLGRMFSKLGFKTPKQITTEVALEKSREILHLFNERLSSEKYPEITEAIRLVDKALL